MLHIHRAERADGLVERAARRSSPSRSPTRSRPRSSPSRRAGWSAGSRSGCRPALGARPGRADGVCANVEFPSPRRLVGDAVAAASGIEPDADPWLPERAVWPLLEVVDECLAEPWLRSLADHLGGAGRRRPPRAPLRERPPPRRPVRPLRAPPARDGPRVGGGRRRRRAGRRAGRPSCGGACASGSAARARPSGSRRACARLRDEPGLVELPQRLSLFGLTRLPAGQLQVLRALAAAPRRPLFLLHPSPALWERVAAAPRPTVRAARDGRDRDARRATGCSPPGARTSRELQLVLAAPASTPTTTTRSTHAGGTLLARIQADVRADRAARRSGADAARSPTTAASRSTPATAAPARSRSCATRSCTCSTRTRRSSRAT